jgi:hypothetical protein
LFGLSAVVMGCVGGGGFAAACAFIVGSTAPGRRRLSRARFAAVAAVTFAVASAAGAGVAFVCGATALV